MGAQLWAFLKPLSTIVLCDARGFVLNWFVLNFRETLVSRTAISLIGVGFQVSPADDTR